MSSSGEDSGSSTQAEGARQTTEELINSLRALHPTGQKSWFPFLSWFGSRRSTGKQTRDRLSECLTISEALTKSIRRDILQNEKSILQDHCSTLLTALNKTTDDPAWRTDALIKKIQRSYVETINTYTSRGYSNACPDWILYMPEEHELKRDPDDYDWQHHRLPDYVETGSRDWRVGKSETERARAAAHETLCSMTTPFPPAVSRQIDDTIKDNMGMFTSVRNTQTALKNLLRACNKDQSIQTSLRDGDYSLAFATDENHSAFQRHKRKTKSALTEDLSRLKSAIDTEDLSKLDPYFKKFCYSALAHNLTHQFIRGIALRADSQKDSDAFKKKFGIVESSTDPRAYGEDTGTATAGTASGYSDVNDTSDSDDEESSGRSGRTGKNTTW